MSTVSPRSLLVLGASGQVGREFVPLATGREWEVLTPSRAQLDLAAPARAAVRVREIRPTVVVNLAAYTAVDRAESDAATASAVNSEAPAAIAQVCAEIGAELIHVSTDYVFDGSKQDPYLETDLPNPTSVYGETKLAGERAIIASGADAYILRSAWIFSRHAANFARTITRRLHEGAPLKVVDDQVGSPTPAAALAEALWHVIASRSREVRPQFGIYHFVAAPPTSWYGFARAIATEFTRATHRETSIERIPTVQYPTPARRPPRSVLSMDRFAKEFAFAQPDWSRFLPGIVAALIAEFAGTSGSGNGVPK